MSHISRVCDDVLETIVIYLETPRDFASFGISSKAQRRICNQPRIIAEWMTARLCSPETLLYTSVKNGLTEVVHHIMTNRNNYHENILQAVFNEQRQVTKILAFCSNNVESEQYDSRYSQHLSANTIRRADAISAFSEYLDRDSGHDDYTDLTRQLFKDLFDETLLLGDVEFARELVNRNFINICDDHLSVAFKGKNLHEYVISFLVERGANPWSGYEIGQVISFGKRNTRGNAARKARALDVILPHCPADESVYSRQIILNELYFQGVSNGHVEFAREMVARGAQTRRSDLYNAVSSSANPCRELLHFVIDVNMGDVDYLPGIGALCGMYWNNHVRDDPTLIESLMLPEMGCTTQIENVIARNHLRMASEARRNGLTRVATWFEDYIKSRSTV